jgi:hypothetical protein
MKMKFPPGDKFKVYLNDVLSDYKSGDYLGPLYPGMYTLKVVGYDPLGNTSEVEIEFKIITGDIIGDDLLDLKDVFGGLKILTHSSPEGVEINKDAAIKGGKLSILDPISILETLINSRGEYPY